MDAGDCHGYFCSNLFEFGVGGQSLFLFNRFGILSGIQEMSLLHGRILSGNLTTTGIDSVGSGSRLIHQRLTDANRFP